MSDDGRRRRRLTFHDIYKTALITISTVMIGIVFEDLGSLKQGLSSAATRLDYVEKTDERLTAILEKQQGLIDSNGENVEWALEVMDEHEWRLCRLEDKLELPDTYRKIEERRDSIGSLVP